MTPIGHILNSVVDCISARRIKLPAVRRTAACRRFRLLTWVIAVVGFAPTIARTVPLPDPAPGTLFVDVTISGTTAAARPELAGQIVQDVLTPYEFSGAEQFLKGTVQNRVVRSDADGTFDFYWRVRPDASSSNNIHSFRVSGFDTFSLDADWKSDGIGTETPDTARHFGNGSVNFMFPNLGDEQSQHRSSRFFFLDTEATQYAMTGNYDLLCPAAGCRSPSFSTFAPVHGIPDLAVTAIGGLEQVGIRPWQGPETTNIQKSQYGGDPAPGGTRGAPIVGFKLYITAKNVSADPDGAGPMSAPAVPWFFPVVETSANPWIIANNSMTFPNGFTGQEGGHNHMHDEPPQPDLPSGHAQEVGPHPHIIHRIFRKPVGRGPKELIGHSDLKHTYLFGPPALHEARPGHQDSYSTSHNQDQSFYSPISEMDPKTFMVAAHDHMGSPYPQLGSGYHRDHGELVFPGSAMMPSDPGHSGTDNIDHILQARVDRLREPGFCHYLTGTYYVVNDVDQDDFDNSNNTFWRQFSPRWHAGHFDPIMLNDNGEGLDTIDSHVCTAPRSASTELSFTGVVERSSLADIEAGRNITGTLKIDPESRDQDSNPRAARFDDPFMPARFDDDRLHALAKLAGYTIVLDSPFPEPLGPDPSPIDRIVIEAAYDDVLTDMMMGDLHDPVMRRDTDLALGIGSSFRTALHFEPGTFVGDTLASLPEGDFDLSGDVLRSGQFEIIDHEGTTRASGRVSSVSIFTIPELIALLRGDVDDDGSINNLDITPFVAALSAADEAAFRMRFPNGNYGGADIDMSGRPDNLDITPFIGLLTAATAMSVPEPSSIVCVVLALTMGCKRPAKRHSPGR